MTRIFGIIIATIVCLGAGFLGSLATMPSIPTWYVALNKPPFNPPNWLFGPVWIILYIMMGIAAYLIFEKGWDKKEVKLSLMHFGFQLVFNVAWSIVFFGLHSPWGAFIVIVILWLLILETIIRFGKLSKPAAWLLVPYILWVSFASILNLAVALLN
ncbi:TspO protein [candidate division WOR-1 bacterium RIFOXYA12_FULL_52_29]|uniref:TspO protein n=1 Tax=candidate division WOR-1 bacterium RIFOXYC12_FULL_54_18 TaxID=1802584 RepID=A0A1F4T7S3_UNCSA|nr:MAG: TspO protein [candidate division WOR-1 bacterium RIFOXYA2_FULL_51_19]OGC18279.1 MAG: TspO protein [candidate division WOR-1 bacterium RIFOXYA12_FULL_52_29]OGC27134.1 MAG: TspO protein [candidate division WOR-1 bacterium RIFOXYB2_FULL_45_9]OGC28696.1 MAG: TspO protein [candidate division WOR-1 bacterium RIFOXYC12_FULL_54_18]OGC30849.1 MAG: TspO protein [candidate division WOR-1 bacterium RIFOXYB12_FULL_52_16]